MKEVTELALIGPVTHARRRIELWRKTRPKRGLMPEGLWREAAQLARIHGVNPIARALGLDYYSLKGHAIRCSRPDRASSPAFVEVSVCGPALSTECVVEMERPDGARMRIRFAGQDHLVALSDSFWKGQP